MAKIQQIWQRWIPGLLEKTVKRGETVESGAEVTKAALEFAIALGVLASVPSAPIVAAGLAFVGIGRKGLTLLHERTNQKFEMEEWVAFACPLAYINSFNALVERNVWLQEKLNAELKEQEVKLQFHQLGQLELDNSKAEEALKQFPNSTLGQALNQELSSYLETKGIRPEIASLVTGCVAWDTYNYIKQLFSYESEDVRQILSLMIIAAQEVRANEKYASIKLYLKEQISPSYSDPLLMERWKVIGEEFKITEIYVPLKAQLLDNNGKPKEKSSVDLENWVTEQLNKPETNRQVIFIQAGPGRGKSVSCKMFAERVRKELHPIWTPILIRLRDIDTFEPNIENTLRAAVRENFANRDDWLSDRNTRYLFILDGFDELRFEGRTAKGIEDFLGQVGNYQAQRVCRHQFIVTGRESALHGIENRLPANLVRLEIALIDDQIQMQWLSKWGRLVGQDKALEFQKFLEADNCPERVKELAREPLLLYLLGAMHRDNELNIKMFEGANDAQAKIIIYQKTLNWVLTKQRPEKLNLELTEFDTEDLRLILIEAGLCVTQSGREWTSIKAIEERLKNDKTAKELLESAQKNLNESPLRNALAAFYLRPAKASSSTEGAVEFIHKSFGEFLCAQKIKESLKQWTKIDSESRRERYVIDDDKLAEEIYDLFGYGGLTQEIVEYLIALLDSEEKFQYLKLFERLENFYFDWCQGKFINGFPKNLPLNQMQKFQTEKILLDLREVDIFTGLNVMILLLELHRYAQAKDELKDNIIFYPCSSDENFEPKKLFHILTYSNSVNSDTFLNTISPFLSTINLERAFLERTSLSQANLEGSNLENADLESADLRGASLKAAKLYKANLYKPNLSAANLESSNLESANSCQAELSFADIKQANLKGANLLMASLQMADLSGANLSGANLRDADLFRAELNNITWDKNTNWNNVQGLDEALNVPKSLLSQLSSTAYPLPPKDTPPSP
ncbi:pentapeptide repeat-containing protein [Nostoc flagelliforme FACHB-838]|uniref:Pentapeptide repeat-containing protein n=1 Tax=Nostoc flagelliforme FACHB-838 TaxID=2692904 RepID=A0ABR8E278_9NOSO|nr:pentapeptide repeat-containing protein [Nostoc flagelliforme]MBD2535756.1 pentapeptide repeat-containing protein [Nostoc flagelliforme FACHB-838]